MKNIERKSVKIEECWKSGKKERRDKFKSVASEGRNVKTHEY